MMIVESATDVGTPKPDSDERAAGTAVSSARSMARCMAITMARSDADCHIQICTARSHSLVIPGMSNSVPNCHMHTRRVWSIAAAVLATISLSSNIAESQQQQRAGPPPPIEGRTTGLRKIDGYFPLYWDEGTGTLLLEI